MNTGVLRKLREEKKLKSQERVLRSRKYRQQRPVHRKLSVNLGSKA